MERNGWIRPEFATKIVELAVEFQFQNVDSGTLAYRKRGPQIRPDEKKLSASGLTYFFQKLLLRC